MPLPTATTNRVAALHRQTNGAGVVIEMVNTGMFFHIVKRALISPSVSPHLLLAVGIFLGVAGKVSAETPGTTMAFDIVSPGSTAVPLGDPAPFEFAVADLDLDGDLDLIVNWHLSGIALFLNENNDEFSHVSREKSGLYQEGNVALAAKDDEVLAFAKSTPGIYLWHSTLPFGPWNIYVNSDESPDSPINFSLRSNEIVAKFIGVDGNEIDRNDALQTRDDTWASFRLDASTLPKHIRFRTRAIGSNIVITHSGDLPFFLGKTFKKVTEDSVSLRMADPHALAWIDIASSEHPDLFVTRGGNRGRLQPPFQAKRNRMFIATGNEHRLFNLQRDPLVPTDYARGRSVSWIDINGDRQNELYLGNKTSSNALLVFDSASDQYQDLSSKYGLALHCGDAFTWLDVDEDSYDDLVFMTCYGSVAIAMNDQGKSFSIVNAEDHGLVLDPVAEDSSLFQSTSLNSFDFDSDGHLDVLVNGFGEQKLLKVFGNIGGEFLDVTDRLGLAGVSSEIAIATDIDADGFTDLVLGGVAGLHIYRNIAGKKFAVSNLQIGEGGPTKLAGISAMAVADFNNDGMKDIVVGDRGRWRILKNCMARVGKTLQVKVRGDDGFEPIGTVVRAHYRSGRSLAQRYGNAEMNGLSQFVFPLAFSVADDDTIEYFTFASPGAPKTMRVEATDDRIVHLN